MSGPPSTIEEEDEDVTTASASFTSEATKTSMLTALKRERVQEQCPSGQKQEDTGSVIANPPGTNETISTDQDTTITGASSDLPLDPNDDPSSGNI